MERQSLHNRVKGLLQPFPVVDYFSTALFMELLAPSPARFSSGPSLSFLPLHLATSSSPGMASSSPHYTLLPSSPVAVAQNEKPPLHRAPSASPQSLSSPDSSRSRFRRAIFLTTGTLAITVLVASLYATNLAMGGPLGGCSRWSGRASETAPQDMTRLRKRDSVQAQTSMYSTTTYTNGKTSTFVYTTRPIVSFVSTETHDERGKLMYAGL
jgi:hypothetical protein